MSEQVRQPVRDAAGTTGKGPRLTGSGAQVAGIKDVFLGNLRSNGIMMVFGVLVIFLAATQPMFLSPANLTNLVLQYSYVLILAMGMLMVIVLAQIDLSVGSVICLVGAVVGVMMKQMDQPWWVCLLAGLAVGLLTGAWQGFWVAVVGIPGFIVSLGGMLIFRGLGQLILNYRSLSDLDPHYQFIANGFINGVLGGQGYDVFTLVVIGIAIIGYAISEWRSRQGQIRYQQAVSPLPLFALKIVAVAAIGMFFAWRVSHDRGLPFILIILAALILLYGTLTQRTAFGRHIYAIGGNLNAAQLSGVKVKWVTFWVFVNMGLLSAVAGIVFSSRINASQPAAGTGFELDAIAACFIGGASTTGGIGRVGGAMIGGLMMAVISNGMQLAGFGQAQTTVVKGLVLLAAVAFDLVVKRFSTTTK